MNHRGLELPAYFVGTLALAVVALSGWSRPVHAAAPSPKVLAALPPGEREAALQRYRERHEALRAVGVDKVYSQFALDLAKYPRNGVAHRNVLVVLCRFPDAAPASVSTPRYVYNHFFSDDPGDNLISLREYYRTNSRGRLIVSGFVTSEWLQMPNSYAYYENGENGLEFLDYPRSSQKLAEDAMKAAYENFDHDLSYFDNDGPDGSPSSGDDDGYIDAVVVIVPGRGAEVSQDPTGRLWAHESGIAIYASCPEPGAGPDCLPGLPLGGVRGFLYSLGSEYNEFPGDNANGTWFHEFSHTLGLPDLYDLTGGNGLGFFSLMAVGNYLPFDLDPNTAGGVQGTRPGNLDAWSRQYLGFDDPIPLAPGSHALASVAEGGGSYKVWSNGEPGTEYFLLENRERVESDRYVPGEGMLIYHIDDTQIDNLGGSYRAAIVQADGLQELENNVGPGRFGDPEDFFPGTTGNTSLTEATNPSSRALDNSVTGVRITNIALAGDSVAFDLQISTKPELRAAGYTINDQGGDTDGYADPNETIQLTLTVRNAGLQAGVTQFNLSTADPAVSITQGLVVGGPIAAGATTTPSSAFTFTIGSIATLPHQIPFTVSWTDDSASSGSFGFVVTVGMGAGLAEGFNNDGEPGFAWTTQALPGSAANEWHATTQRASEGTHSAKLGSSLPPGSASNEALTYADYEDAVLISPMFDLAANAELAFDSWIDAETFGGTEAFDGGRVEISMNGGEWTPIAVDGGYGYQIKFNTPTALRGADVFSGTARAWRRVTADLAGYAGPAQIRFRFASDEGNSPYGQFGQLRVYEGWYVDNVRVQARTQTGPVARRVSLRGGPSPYRIGAPSAGSIHFRFSAPDGLPHPELRPEIQIFDVAGRFIRAVTSAPNGLIASEFTSTWDARDARGQKVRAGIYFAKVDIQGKSETFRLVLIR